MKGFQLYSLQTADMDLYSDPVMSIGLYKVTDTPQIIVYETSAQIRVYKEFKGLMLALHWVCLLP